MGVAWRKELLRNRRRLLDRDLIVVPVSEVAKDSSDKNSGGGWFSYFSS